MRLETTKRFNAFWFAAAAAGFPMAMACGAPATEPMNEAQAEEARKHVSPCAGKECPKHVYFGDTHRRKIDRKGKLNSVGATVDMANAT